MIEEDFDLLFKIVIVGDSGVGKTNLVSRYLKNEFSDNTKATVGVEFGEKKYQYNDSMIKAQIWDTAGQERYRSVTSLYYKGSKGAIVVFDITSKTSFDNIDKWITEMRKTTDPSISVILIGNKIDLEDNRVISTSQGEEKAKNLGVAYIETSALNAENVDKAFNYMIETIANNVKKEKEDDEFEFVADGQNTISLRTGNEVDPDETCCALLK